MHQNPFRSDNTRSSLHTSPFNELDISLLHSQHIFTDPYPQTDASHISFSLQFTQNFVKIRE